jgi:zinc transport system substrate-binding protein
LRLKNYLKLAFCAGAVGLIASGCHRETKAAHGASPAKLQVVATIFPLADWVRAVGGSRVDVTTLLPAGRSPHTFDPTPGEIRSLHDANVFFKVGLQMDDWGGRLASGAKPNLRVIALGDLLAGRRQLPDVDSLSSGPEIGAAQAAATAEPGQHHHHDEGVNPHYWLDPQLAKLSVADIRDALSTADPEGSATYAANAQSYLQRLDALDERVRQDFSGCGRQSFISFHNAYPYLANRYGLKLAGVIEEYPGKTPSERYIKAIADRIRELKISTVFSEPQLNAQIAEVLAREVGVRVDVLDPYGSESAPERNSYEKLVEYDAQKLKEALCR